MKNNFLMSNYKKIWMLEITFSISLFFLFIQKLRPTSLTNKIVLQTEILPNFILIKKNFKKFKKPIEQ